MKPKWILAAAALLLTGTGVACRLWVLQLSAQHDKIERLPLLNAPDFRKAKPGAEVLVAGALSDRNPLVFEEFVSLIRYRQSDKRAWLEESRQTPPLWLSASDGEVHVVNANYRLEALESTRRVAVAEHGLKHWQAPTDASLLVTGFGRGNRLLAFGKVQPSAGVAELEATWIYGGTRDEWLADSARSFGVARLVPWTLWALAAVFIGLAFLRR